MASAAATATAAAPSHVDFKEKGPSPPFAVAPVPYETIGGVRTRLASTVRSKAEWLNAQFYEVSDAEMDELETAEEAARVALEHVIIRRGKLNHSKPVQGGMCFLAVLPSSGVETGTAFVAFCRHLASAEEQGDALVLPDGVHWGGSKQEGRKLYIRPHYKRLYDLMIKDQELTATMLTGTPGVGKSHGAWYFLYRAVREMQGDEAWWSDIIYLHQHGERSAVFRKDGAVEFVPDAIERASSTTLVISDSRGVPSDTQACVRIITSPKTELADLFKSTPIGVVQYVLPPFSLKELEACRKVRFEAQLTAEQLKGYFERWGGSARNTLTRGTERGQTLLLRQFESLITSKTAGNLVDAVKATAQHSVLMQHLAAIPHMVLHTFVATQGPDAYMITASRVCWASETLRETWLEHAKMKLEAQSAELFSGFAHIDNPSLSGHAFAKTAAHALFGAAGTHKLYPLFAAADPAKSRDEAVTLDMPVRAIKQFWDVGALLPLWREEGGTAIAAAPFSFSWPSWDAATLDDPAQVTFWRLTISTPQAHRLSKKGFLDAKRLLERDRTARIVWVVPAHKLDESLAGTAVPVQTSSKWVKDIRQFVVAVDFPMEALSAAGAGSAASSGGGGQISGSKRPPSSREEGEEEPSSDSEDDDDDEDEDESL